MKLIREITEEVQVLVEKTDDGKKNLFIEGIFLQSAIKNRNGRVYPEHVMDGEVARYVKEQVEQKRALGELSHPEGPQINLDRVSHLITSLKKEGTDYVGKAKIVDTPMGNIARGMLESGVKLGVSSRGMGSIKANTKGIMEVQSDFRLATAADIVADPSAPSAFVNGIYEGAEFFFDERLGWRMLEQIEETKKQILKAKRIDEETALQMWNKFIRNL